MTGSRPDWPHYAMRLAEVAAMRSEDPYVKVGACVLRRDYSIGGLGYNGAPTGVELDWSDREERRKYVIHAEANALRYIKPDEGLLLAVTLMPCTSCITLIASYRIEEVFYESAPLMGDPAECIRVSKQLGIKMRQLPRR